MHASDKSKLVYACTPVIWALAWLSNPLKVVIYTDIHTLIMAMLRTRLQAAKSSGPSSAQCNRGLLHMLPKDAVICYKFSQGFLHCTTHWGGRLQLTSLWLLIPVLQQHTQPAWSDDQLTIVSMDCSLAAYTRIACSP